MSENGRKIINIIISIIVAVGAWTYVVYNNDPTTEVSYKDIPISFVGEDVLANNGLGVSLVSAESIDVTLRQKRVDTNNISAEDISVIADVSSAVEGENGISLQISGPNGTQVAEAEKRSLAVEVEPSDTVEKEIKVQYETKIPGAEPVVSNLTSSMATVIGAESEIARVDSVAALIGYDDASDNTPRKFTSSLKALDSDGDTIEHLVIYPGEVYFLAYNGMIKEVPLNVITEEPQDETADDQTEAEAESDDEEEGDGYIRRYTAPNTVVIKGTQEAIDRVDSISTEVIDLSNYYEDTEMDLELQLPEGIHLASESENLTIKINVTKKNN